MPKKMKIKITMTNGRIFHAKTAIESLESYVTEVICKQASSWLLFEEGYALKVSEISSIEK